MSYNLRPVRQSIRLIAKAEARAVAAANNQSIIGSSKNSTTRTRSTNRSRARFATVVMGDANNDNDDQGIGDNGEDNPMDNENGAAGDGDNNGLNGNANAADGNDTDSEDEEEEVQPQNQNQQPPPAPPPPPPPERPPPRRLTPFEHFIQLLVEIRARYEASPVMKFGSILIIVIAMLSFAFNSPPTGITNVPGFTTTTPTTDTKQIRARQDFFTNSMNLLFKKQFKSQEVDTRYSLIAEGESVLDDPKLRRQPSVITILIPPTVSYEFATCFVKKIGRHLNEAVNLYNPVKEITLETFNKAGKEDMTSIHKDLLNYLKTTGKVILFHDIDKLQLETQLNILHAFCDNFQAPDKTATIFFLLKVPLHIYDENNWYYSNGGVISYSILDEAWSTAANRDKRPAIIARVTPTVILLQDGDTCEND